MKNKIERAAVTFELTVALVALILSSCAPRVSHTAVGNMITPLASTPVPAPTSGHPAYDPGELVEYIAQTGDTIPALAARFNTTEAEIYEANPIIPRDATTMPPGLPMQIPIYYLPLWGTEFQSIPDSAFVNGPAQVGFSASAFVASTSGWLRDYRAYAGGRNRTGAELVEYVAVNYSISPRLLLAILEYQGGALTQPEPPASRYLLGFRRVYYESPYLQLVIAANTLNNGYYGWRSGHLTEFELPDGSLFRPDPWQNGGDGRNHIAAREPRQRVPRAAAASRRGRPRPARVARGSDRAAWTTPAPPGAVEGDQGRASTTSSGGLSLSREPTLPRSEGTFTIANV